MKIQRSRVPPLVENEGEIAPHQLWSKLTTGQQQHLHRTLISVSQHWLKIVSDPTLPEEQEHDCDYQPNIK